MTITTQHDEKGQFTAHSQENFHLRQTDSLSGCKLVLNDDVSEHLGWWIKTHGYRSTRCNCTTVLNVAVLLVNWSCVSRIGICQTSYEVPQTRFSYNDSQQFRLLSRTFCIYSCTHYHYSVCGHTMTYGLGSPKGQVVIFSGIVILVSWMKETNYTLVAMWHRQRSHAFCNSNKLLCKLWDLSMVKGHFRPHSS